MSKPRLIYRELKGYKYEVEFSISYLMPELKHLEFDNKYLCLKDGVLDINKGYAWDGASGPTWDDKTNMRASLVHDALYQILREMTDHYMERSFIRSYADDLLRKMGVEDSKNKGLAKLRYNAWHSIVRIFAKRSSTPKQKPRGKLVEIM